MTIDNVYGHVPVRTARTLVRMVRTGTWWYVVVRMVRAGTWFVTQSVMVSHVILSLPKDESMARTRALSDPSPLSWIRYIDRLSINPSHHNSLSIDQLYQNYSQGDTL